MTIMPPNCYSGFPTRRRFLVHLGLGVVTPCVLAGCRGRSDTDEIVDDDQKGQPRPLPPSHEPIIRVRLARHRASDESLVIENREGWIRVSAGDSIETTSSHQEDQHRTRFTVKPGRAAGVRWTPSLSGDQRVLLRAPIAVKHGPEGWRILDAWQGQVVITGCRSLEVTTAGIAERGLVYDDQPYPGKFRLVQWDDANRSTFDVINHVLLEDYLPGVLAGELFEHWHLQTHAAQAIAARSFACCEQAWFYGRRHYDVRNTARSQMYVGGSGHDIAQEAVMLTRGKLLAWRDALVPGYYSSCCGGRAACAVDAISSSSIHDIPPLRGRSTDDVCQGAPRYQWENERQLHTFTRRLQVFGQARGIKELKNLSTVKSVSAIHRNANNRPTRYRIVDRRKHTAEISAARLLQGANYSGQGLHAPRKPLYSSQVEASVTEKTITFTGRGFGHGVGLCQYGAETLASRGKSHESILQWYYPDVELITAYG